MHSGNNWLLCICSTLLILSVTADPRRVRVRPQEADVEEQSVAANARSPRVQYYAAQDPEEQQQVVLVSTDEYNGLYGQPQPRVIHDNYIPHSRSSAPLPQSSKTIQQRVKETPKAPPVQTIRNYNKVNDDGSFTFGYEAADGSFKEETRGTDCVVRGKYGYVDPDGNKREFTYVSGNPCDPNAAAEDSDERRESKSRQEDDEDDGIANYPKQFPVRPSARPTPPPTRPPVTVFQNVFSAEGEDEEPEQPLQVLRPQTPRTRPIIQPRPTVSYIQPQPQPQPQPERRPFTYQLQHIQPTTPNSVAYQSTPVSITPRPTTVKAQLPATTYRPQLVAVTPRPQPLYTKEIETHPPAVRYFPSSTPSPITRTPSGTIDFAAELQKFAQEHNVISSTPKTLAKTTEKIKPSPFQSSDPIYSSELVFDPASGQYKTQLYQTLPQTTGDFTLNHRIQPYVTPIQSQPHRLVLPQLQQPTLYRPIQQPQPQLRPQPSQQLYQQQQAELQFQNSAQLYAQQQRARAAAAGQRSAPSPVQVQSTSHAPQQFYFIQPQSINAQHQSLASGQIEAFLRGHNIQLQ